MSGMYLYYEGLTPRELHAMTFLCKNHCHRFFNISVKLIKKHVFRHSGIWYMRICPNYF